MTRKEFNNVWKRKNGSHMGQEIAYFDNVLYIDNPYEWLWHQGRIKFLDTWQGKANNGSQMSNTWEKRFVSNLGLIVNDYLVLRQ